jgi:hypothetical protein
MLTRAPAALPRLDAAVAWSDGGLATAMRLGATLRLFGMRAVVDTEARGPADAKNWWRSVGAANLLHCKDGGEVAWSADGRRTRTLPPEQVAARLAGGEQ